MTVFSSCLCLLKMYFISAFEVVRNYGKYRKSCKTMVAFRGSHFDNELCLYILFIIATIIIVVKQLYLNCTCVKHVHSKCNNVS